MSSVKFGVTVRGVENCALKAGTNNTKMSAQKIKWNNSDPKAIRPMIHSPTLNCGLMASSS